MASPTARLLLLPLLFMSAVCAQAQNVEIGAILPLTGASASIGEDQRRGIQLAVDRLNAAGGVLGKPFSVIVEDSGGRAPTALDAARKLISVNKVPAVLGEYSSGISIPMGQYLVKEGAVHVNIGSSSPKVREIGDSSFSVIGLDDVSAKFAADDVKALGYKKAVFIAPNSAYGQGVAAEFKKNFVAGGGQLVSELLYTPGQSTYRRELQQMAQFEPDVYVYSAYGQEAAVINREAFDLAINKTPWYAIYLTMCTTDTPAQIANGQMGMEVSAVGPKGDAYRNAYQAKYKEPLKSAYGSYAYDGVMLLAAAIEQAKSTERPAVLAATRTVGANFEAATGAIAFDKDGQRTVQPYDKVKYQGGVITR